MPLSRGFPPPLQGLRQILWCPHAGSVHKSEHVRRVGAVLLSSLPEPLQRLAVIPLRAVSPCEGRTEPELRDRVPLLRSHPPPLHRLLSILLHAFTGCVHIPEALQDSTVAVPVHRGLSEPPCCLRWVLRGAASRVVHCSEYALRIGIALLSGLLYPPECLLFVLHSATALRIGKAKP